MCAILNSFVKILDFRSSCVGSAETNLTSIHEDTGLIPGLAQWGKDLSCGVGCRCSSDLAWMWLWHRPATAAAVQPLAWEHPYAVGAALKFKKKKESKNCFN